MKRNKKKIAAGIILLTMLGIIIGITVNKKYEADIQEVRASEKRYQENVTKELNNASNYLTAIEKAISENKSKLQNINISANQTESILTALDEKTEKAAESNRKIILENIEKVKQDIMIMKNYFKIFSEESNIHNQEINEQFMHAEKQMEENMKTLAEAFTNLSKKTEKESEIIQQEIVNSTQILQLDLINVEKLVTGTQLEISTVLEGMKEDNADSIAEIKKQIGEVETAISHVEKGMQNAHMQLREMIAVLQQSSQKNHAETLGILSAMESSLKDTTSQKIAESLHTLQTAVSSGNQDVKTEMSGSFQSLNSSLEQKVDGLSGSINGKFQDTANLINQNHQTLIAIIDAFKNASDQKFNQVFQSVSNGKKAVASALLTKGVTIRQDASFQEIQKAILNIEQKIEVGKLPGTISYDYHYHVDDAGNVIHSDSNSIKGGCYTNAVYHTHSNSKGCYRTETFHTHNSNCPGSPMWVDWVKPPYWGWAYECGDQPHNSSKQVLICSKSSSTIDAYRCSCGLADGQIIGAHIVYQ